VSKPIDGAIEVRGSDETVATKPRAISAVDEFDRSFGALTRYGRCTQLTRGVDVAPCRGSSPVVSIRFFGPVARPNGVGILNGRRRACSSNTWAKEDSSKPS
jgi:hypothetical protein